MFNLDKFIADSVTIISRCNVYKGSRKSQE